MPVCLLETCTSFLNHQRHKTDWVSTSVWQNLAHDTDMQATAGYMASTQLTTTRLTAIVAMKFAWPHYYILYTCICRWVYSSTAAEWQFVQMHLLVQMTEKERILWKQNITNIKWNKAKAIINQWTIYCRQQVAHMITHSLHLSPNIKLLQQNVYYTLINTINAIKPDLV